MIIKIRWWLAWKLYCIAVRINYGRKDLVGVGRWQAIHSHKPKTYSEWVKAVDDFDAATL
jgi:hypothetical protein